MDGDINTFTSREQTGCYARVFSKDVGKVLEILADILQNSTFDAEQIEQLRDVILFEIEKVCLFYDFFSLYGCQFVDISWKSASFVF